MSINKNYLTPDSLNAFANSLRGMAVDEIQKAKELFIKNAISDYETAVKKFNNLLFLRVFLFIIPIFWPFLIVLLRNEYLDLKNSKNQILNTIEVWGDDLGDKKIELENLLEGNSYWG